RISREKRRSSRWCTVHHAIPSTRYVRPMSPTPAAWRVVRHEADRDEALGANGDSVLVCGDARRVLESLPAGSVQCVVTSPPYWSLRDYGVDDQLGRDEDLYEFIKQLVQVFDEVRRVLRDDGTCWLNIGDSYTSGNRTWRAPDRKNPARAMRVRPRTPDG